MFEKKQLTICFIAILIILYFSSTKENFECPCGRGYKCPSFYGKYCPYSRAFNCPCGRGLGCPFARGLICPWATQQTKLGQDFGQPFDTDSMDYHEDA